MHRDLGEGGYCPPKPQLEDLFYGREAFVAECCGRSSPARASVTESCQTVMEVVRLRWQE